MIPDIDASIENDDDNLLDEWRGVSQEGTVDLVGDIGIL